MSMTRRYLSGFTLIEVIIFIVVVSAGLAGILLVSNTVVAASADPMVRKQAISVAESMLEEILLKEYTKPSDSTAVAYNVSGWSRAMFDTVDDYNGYNTTGGITDVSGAVVAGLSGYNISPAITVAANSDLTGVNAKKITVTVTWAGGSVALVGYRGDY